MTSIKKLCCIFFITMLASLNFINSSKAYIPIISEVKDSFDNEVKKTSQSIGAGFRDQFQIATDDLFNNKIKPLLDDINSIAEKQIEGTDTVIKNRLDQLDHIIKDSMAEIKGTTDQFSKIIDKTYERINQLQGNFKKDIDHIFNRLDDLIDCKVDAVTEKAKIDIELIRQSFIPKLSFFNKDQCYKELSISQAPKNWEYTTIYKLEKCRKLHELNGDTPIDNILRTYIDLRALCARTRCIQRSSGKLDYFDTEYVELGHAYDTWKNTQRSSGKLDYFDTELENTPFQIQPLQIQQ